MYRSLACGLAFSFATPAVASAALPHALPAASATVGVSAGAQLFFAPGPKPNAIDIFKSTKPNTPYATIDLLGVPSGSTALLAGVDEYGTLYVNARNPNTGYTILKYAPPYNGMPASCPFGATWMAVAYDGTIALFGYNLNGANGLVAVPPNSCSPTVTSPAYSLASANEPSQYVVGIDSKNTTYVEVTGPDNSYLFNAGIVKFPARSDQPIDTGLGFQIPRYPYEVQVDGSGNLLVWQVEETNPASIPPQIDLFHPGQNTPYKTVTMPPDQGTCSDPGLSFFFDAAKTHIYIPGYVNQNQTAELTYPGFRLVREIGLPGICSPALFVFPRAQ